jgi:hypothetical protein
MRQTLRAGTVHSMTSQLRERASADLIIITRAVTPTGAVHIQIYSSVEGRDSGNRNEFGEGKRMIQKYWKLYGRYRDRNYRQDAEMKVIRMRTIPSPLQAAVPLIIGWFASPLLTINYSCVLVKCSY